MATIVTTETTGEGQGRAREERQGLEMCRSMFLLFIFSYFLSTKLLFTFRTTAMTTNGHATTSTAATATATLFKRKQQQQPFFHFFIFLKQLDYMRKKYNGNDEHTMTKHLEEQGGSRCVCISSLR